MELLEHFDEVSGTMRLSFNGDLIVVRQDVVDFDAEGEPVITQEVSFDCEEITKLVEYMGRLKKLGRL